MTLRASLRRADWLKELQSLLAVVVVLNGVAVVARAGATVIGQPLDVRVSSADVLRPDALLDAPARVSVDATLGLRVEHPTGAQIGWDLLATLPGHLLLLAALVLLWRLVATARRDDPFTGDMVRRLRVLGWLLMAGGPVVWVAEFVGRFALSATLTGGGPSEALNLAVPVMWGLCGFGTFAIGEILRRGRALRTELDGVV